VLATGRGAAGRLGVDPGVAGGLGELRIEVRLGWRGEAGGRGGLGELPR
jgi:hypothetical protein